MRHATSDVPYAEEHALYCTEEGAREGCWVLAAAMITAGIRVHDRCRSISCCSIPLP